MDSEARKKSNCNASLVGTARAGDSERRRLAEELAKSIPREHLEFLESLDLSFGCGDFFFVYAGIRPGVPIREQTEDDLLWIRDFSPTNNRSNGLSSTATCR